MVGIYAPVIAYVNSLIQANITNDIVMALPEAKLLLSVVETMGLELHPIQSRFATTYLLSGIAIPPDLIVTR
jgi:hypothetical protein